MQKRFLTSMFCVAAFLGLVDAAISVSTHIYKNIIPSGQLDVQSVEKSTDVYINKEGFYESPVAPHSPLVEIVHKPENKFTPAIRFANLTPVDLNANDDNEVDPHTSIKKPEEKPAEKSTNTIRCGCSIGCTCLNNGNNCPCVFSPSAQKCNSQCNCTAHPKMRPQTPNFIVKPQYIPFDYNSPVNNSCNNDSYYAGGNNACSSGGSCQNNYRNNYGNNYGWLRRRFRGCGRGCF